MTKIEDSTYVKKLKQRARFWWIVSALELTAILALILLSVVR